MGRSKTDRAQASRSQYDGREEVIYRQSNKINRVYKVTAASVRFWRRVQKTEGCWLWIGGRTGPYGMVGGGIRAHEWTAKNVHGWKPNHQKVVDHICRNKLCVRPDHLRLVPQRENVLNSPT